MTFALESPASERTRFGRSVVREFFAAIVGGMAIGIAGAFALSAYEHAPVPVREAAAEPARASLAELTQPMRFRLEENGVLYAQGSIEAGSAAKLEQELQEHGNSIKRLSINSTGGSLNEAMAMGRLLRKNGISSAVADGAICASSCPLLFAGGLRRSAGTRAAIGVHQFYARPVSGLRGTADAMADAQITTARISRHLAEMGVDPALWLHALDTPPSTLYYFSSWELAKYRLTSDETSTPASIVFGSLSRLLGAI